MSKPSTTVYMTSEETGYRYRRYPESKHRNGRVYWVRTKPGGGAKYFHVDLWELHNGPVPEKHHIHHADHDPLNNSITNLICISASDHLSHHMSNLSEERVQQMRENMDRVREKASEWHRSEDGRAWHAQNSLAMWERRKPRQMTCECCGNTYETIAQRSRFCSNACKSKKRRQEKSDWIEVPCNGCGVVRSLNQYQLRDYCLPCSRWPQRRTLELIQNRNAVPAMV